MSRFWGILSLVLIGSHFSMVACAQGAVFELGAVYSPKEAGLSYTFESTDGSAWQMIRLVADIPDVVTGEVNTPGARLIYNIAYPIKSWKSINGTVIDLVAGPGAVLGCVKDHDSDRFAALGGLNGLVGLYHHFTSRFVLGLNFSVELGLCINGNNTKDTSISFWKNGVRQAIMPELSIGYRF